MLRNSQEVFLRTIYTIYRSICKHNNWSGTAKAVLQYHLQAYSSNHHKEIQNEGKSKATNPGPSLSKCWLTYEVHVATPVAAHDVGSPQATVPQKVLLRLNTFKSLQFSVVALHPSELSNHAFNSAGYVFLLARIPSIRYPAVNAPSVVTQPKYPLQSPVFFIAATRSSHPVSFMVAGPNWRIHRYKIDLILSFSSGVAVLGPVNPEKMSLNQCRSAGHLATSNFTQAALSGVAPPRVVGS